MIPNSFAELAARLSPAVVNITTTTNVAEVERGPGPALPPGSPFEEFFRDFMDRQGQGREGPRQHRSNALGSGFIISADGYIVTNNHVVEQADEVRVELFEGGEYDAKVIGRDPRTDIALLKIDAGKDLPFVEFGNSDAAKVGDWVLAIGNPLGQGFSVSSGIVSARNRTLQGSYDDFIQTDAAINRGNSGGPLFDMDGEVIGVNTAILSPNGGSIGIGFAMSSAVVSRVVDQLKDFGETRRGWLGVRIQNVDDDMADALGLKETQGALVTDVPEGPAAKAGLKSGDVIISYDGETIDDTRELVRLVADTEIDRTVPIEVIRGGERETLQVKIGLLEEPTLAAATGPDKEQHEVAETVLGLALSPIGPEQRETFGLGDELKGLVVTSVEEGSDAFDKGMREGDVIVEVGQEPVTTPREMRERIKAAEDAGRNSILLLVRRDDQPRFVALNLSN
ncbi:DegQ family serine endoprotease [Amaricoccus sp.]|uniref:DegQ family serine endoprotease n=1 Tax=Amaricoccus sp. TaxID=1872485 RepID=UPI0025C6B367|nr:DegQ family serine endoprotease [Amaricoccus sp.]